MHTCRQVQVLKVGSAAIVDVKCFAEVGITVGEETEQARVRVEVAEPAIGTSHHTHIVPQVACAQVPTAKSSQ